MPLYAVILSNNLAPTRPSTDWLLGVAYWINPAGVAGGVNRRISTNSKTRMNGKVWSRSVLHGHGGSRKVVGDVAHPRKGLLG